MTESQRKAMEQAYRALVEAAPRLDQLVCYGSTISEHPDNGIPIRMYQAIAALDVELQADRAKDK